MMIKGRPRSPVPATAPAASSIPAPPVEAKAAAASPPEAPARTKKSEHKAVAAPPGGKRSDGDKRATRRKNTGARKRK
jgi:hypothetical protein